MNITDDVLPSFVIRALALTLSLHQLLHWRTVSSFIAMYCKCLPQFLVRDDETHPKYVFQSFVYCTVIQCEQPKHTFNKR